MCHLLESVENHLNQKKSNDGSHHWSPLKATKCSKKVCEDLVKMVKYTVTYFQKSIKNGMLNDKVTAVVEKKFREEQMAFSEHERILKHALLAQQEKSILLNTPTKAKIEEFLSTLFEFADIKPEVLVSALVLLRRALKKTGWELRSTNWRILLITAVRLVQKVEDQPTLTLDDLSLIYPLFRRCEFAALERTFLKLIGYNCAVHGEEYALVLHQILPPQSKISKSTGKRIPAF
mmetsp:Transcript_32733/g.37118  ORF Transcript_32733/g.37118 Transcript_32733/m.37118 type:complete len:234 (-) Transcript_32733:652-1353(-)